MSILLPQPWVLQLAQDLQGKSTYLPTPYDKPPTKQRWSGQSSSSPRTDVNHLIREINLPGERFDTVLEPLRPVMMGSEDPKATDNGGLNDPCDLEPPPKHIPPPSRDHPPTSQQVSIASLRMRALQRRPTTTTICPPQESVSARHPTQW